MPIQRFVIEYESRKPLFPINTFQFVINQEYTEKNLKTLKDTLQFILGHLQFIPLDKSNVSQTTAKRKRTCCRQREHWATGCGVFLPANKRGVTLKP